MSGGSATGATDTAWIAPLLERYREVVANGGEGAAALVDGFNTLRLADALLDKAALAAHHPGHPSQIALLGPTQSGKSTLANLLLDAAAAGVSALAGYTVHATGLASGCDETALAPLGAVMAPLRRVPRAALDHDALDAFALDAVSAGPRALLSRAVVWDTPDFDSIEAGGYRGAVLQGAAIADVHVLVASKDKYGDRSVWDMLELLHGLGRPLLVCLNKLDAADEAVVTRAFSTRFEERFGSTLAGAPTPGPASASTSAPADPPTDSLAALVTLPFVRGARPDAPHDAPDDTVPEMPEAARERLGAALDAAVARIDRERQGAAARAFVAAHRERWLAPLGHELAAAAAWRELVEETLGEAEEEYVRRYLDDPRRYDTFNRALAELLTLLELPGVAQALARARELVTWPARTLLGIGRRRLGGERPPAPDQEAEVLEQVLQRALTRLQGALIERGEEMPEQSAWWRARARRLPRRARATSRGASSGGARRYAPRSSRASRRRRDACTSVCASSPGCSRRCARRA